MVADPVLLLVRFFAVVAIIVAVSVASDRLGAFWGAVAASMPISIGPSYVLLAMQHDPEFIAHAALASLANYAATVLYVVAYVKFAPGRSAFATIALCVVVWLAGVLAISHLPLSILTAAVLNVLVFAIGFRVTRGPFTPTATQGAGKGWGVLLLKSAAMGALVAGVVTWSTFLGPKITGIAVLFPIAMSSLALAFHPHQGGDVAAGVMAKALWTLPGIGFGLLFIALTVVRLGLAISLGLALAVSLIWPLGAVALRHLPRRTVAPKPTA
jgi:hypothetical protein